MPHPRSRGPITITIAAALALAAGCNDGTPSVDSSTTEATVRGVVTFKGKPVEAGEIILDPSNHLRKVGGRSGAIGPDGQFAVKTYTGNNRIKVAGALLKAHPELFYMKRFIEVGPGESTADIELADDGDPAAKVPGGKMPRLPTASRR